MTSYLLAMMLLSAGSFIRTRSAAPEMRPASAGADMVWGWVATAALWAWIGLVVWGFLRLHWSQPVAAVMASLAINALIAMRGPMRSWPGLSMIFSAGGLLAAALTVFRHV